MEILMRAKEASNPKFQFLNPDNPYHQIYKQVKSTFQIVIFWLLPIAKSAFTYVDEYL